MTKLDEITTATDDDSTAALRAQVAKLQSRYDSLASEAAYLEESGQKAETARDFMTAAAAVKAAQFRAAVAAAAANGEPEPTLTYSQAAQMLSKFVKLGNKTA